MQALKIGPTSEIQTAQNQSRVLAMGQTSLQSDYNPTHRRINHHIKCFTSNQADSGPKSGRNEIQPDINTVRT